jgi:steroid delta-isomerase-like uncharacterized protein
VSGVHGETQTAVAGSVAANKALVRRFIEQVMTGGKMDLVQELVAADFVNHNEVGTGEAETKVGRDAFAVEIQRVRDAFPDLTVEIQQIIAEDDVVAVRNVASGTHLGSIGASMSTGRHGRIVSYTIFRVQDNQLAERWNLMDRLAMLQQLGVMPA